MVPFWDLDQFPEPEHPAIRNVHLNLMRLDSYVSDFWSAATLFQHSLSILQKPERTWAFVAARDGAMTIFHFGKIMEGVRSSFGPCPTLRKLIDHTKLRDAVKLHKETFPTFEKARHAVAHSAELFTGVAAEGKNAKRTETGGIEISIGNIYGDRFVNTIEGVEVSYELNQRSLNALAETRNIFFTGFLEVPRY